jgi:hypothetical protein
MVLLFKFCIEGIMSKKTPLLSKEVRNKIGAGLFITGFSLAIGLSKDLTDISQLGCLILGTAIIIFSVALMAPKDLKTNEQQDRNSTP